MKKLELRSIHLLLLLPLEWQGWEHPTFFSAGGFKEHPLSGMW